MAKNQNFIYPYSACKIDFIEPEEIETGNYQIFVKVNAFSEGSIPEIFGFVNPKYPLLYYLKIQSIPFHPEKKLLLAFIS